MSPGRVFIVLVHSFIVFSSVNVDKCLGRKFHIRSCSNPPHFVFAHGYGNAGCQWFRMKSLAENAGYKATALDLKGCGIDPTNTSSVASFDEYNKPLVDFLANLPNDENVILVGYSAGGLSVTDLSHKFSKKVKVAVYIAATMLKHGFVTRQDLLDGAPPFTRKDWPPASAQPPEIPHVSFQQVNNSTEIAKPPEMPAVSFQEDGYLGIPFRGVSVPMLVRTQFKGEAAENVPRVYIKTLTDVTLLPEQQDAMIKRWPPAAVFPLATGHGLLTPQVFVLFGLLVRIAESIHCN